MKTATEDDIDYDLDSLTPGEQAHLLLSLLESQERDIDDADESICEEFGREDPRDFIRDILGEKPSDIARKYGYTDPFTPQQSLAYASVLEHKNTAIPSANGMGKSHLVARLCLWWLFRKPRSIFVFTAPSNRQVEAVLWNEILECVRRSKRPLPVKILNSPYPRLVLGNKWFAIGFSTKPTGDDLAATMFQGFHSEHVAIAYDEAVGIAPEIKDAGDSITLSPTDRVIATANPTDPTAWFKLTACDSSTWNTVPFDGLEHPNVIHDNPLIIPGAITKPWIAERLEMYGSERAPLYLARCRGVFPDQSTDALIKKSWLARAQRISGVDEDPLRNAKDDGYGVVLGVDISGEGDDIFPVFAIKDSRLFMPQTGDGKYAWQSGRDTMTGVTMIRNVLKEVSDVRAIALDDTALGGGVSARLQQLNSAGKLPMYRAGTYARVEQKKIRIIPVNFGATAWTKDNFRRTKDEMWFDFREALRADKVLLPTKGERAAYGMPRDSDLILQLGRTIYDTVNGRVVVYDKRGAGGQTAEARKKTASLPTKSPDCAHAAILAWHARLQTRKLDRQPRLTSTKQIFNEQTREIIEKAVGRKAARNTITAKTPRTQKGGARPSWTRRRT